jgi:hypothetical protein
VRLMKLQFKLRKIHISLQTLEILFKRIRKE